MVGKNRSTTLIDYIVCVDSLLFREAQQIVVKYSPHSFALRNEDPPQETGDCSCFSNFETLLYREPAPHPCHYRTPKQLLPAKLFRDSEARASLVAGVHLTGRFHVARRTRFYFVVYFVQL